MSHPGPWGVEPPSEPRPSTPPRASWRRWLVWLVLVGAGMALLGLLFRAAPWAMRETNDWFYLVWGGLLALVLSAGLMRATRRQALHGLGYAALWVVIVAVLAVGYLYRAELAEAPQRLRMALNTGEPVATGERELRVAQDASGAFVVVGQVNGQRVLFLVDTGASNTVLSPADAQRVGVDMAALRYDQTSETANGLGYGASWTADRLDIGPIRRDRFPMDVNRAPMSASLLGMTFLNTLDSYEVRGGQLILRWKE
ncbi:retropepsin-like aspartic protease family protein [Caulobacter flavus]|uniref:retropepsin-like aspartic protease family protein n=1 Tax=Caulobacter flavus TaxID=1679497 RepID=UPI0011AECD64|nr:TIGR02281 family clan AA aspartic protease [Caulobacter flavus]